MPDFTQADQDAAYAAAEAAIEKAQKASSLVLKLDGWDFRPLSKLPPGISALSQLQAIWLGETGIHDLSPLKALSKLKSLWIDHTKVEDLSHLRGMKYLAVLILNNTAISDLTSLSSLSRLQTLSLNHSEVSDLAPIAGLANLRTLSLEGCAVSNLEPLARLTELRTLNLSQSKVGDLSPLSGLTEMRDLQASKTSVSDLRPLSAMRNLRAARFNETSVSDLTPLARLTRLQELWLNDTKVSDLTPLAEVASLQDLAVSGTGVSNVEPLAGLGELRYLSLDRTVVQDLRALLGLSKLGQGPYNGISFANTPAAAADPELLRLSTSGYHKKRTREALAHLRNLPPWPQPLNEPVPAEQDAALPLIWGERGFSFLAAQVAADPVTEAALDDLRSLLEDLRRKGNRHEDLYRLAGELQDRAKGDIADLNMVRLHLSYQKLRRLYDGRASRVEAFDDETVLALGATLEILPGVTLADAGVKILIERQEAERATPLPPAQAAAADLVLATVQEETAPFAPEVKDIAQAIQAPGHDDRLAASRGILSRNAVIVVLSYVGLRMVDATITGPVGNYLYAHGPDFLAYAQTMGADAFYWAQLVISRFSAEYELSMGILREAVGSGVVTRRKRPGGEEDDPG